MKTDGKIIVLAYPKDMDINELNRLIGETIELSKSNIRLSADEALVTIIGTDEIRDLSELSTNKSNVIVALENIIELVGEQGIGTSEWENRFWWRVYNDIQGKGGFFTSKVTKAFIDANKSERAYFKKRGVPQIVDLMKNVQKLL